MIVLVIVLILVSFLQSALLPVDLVFLILIARAFIVDEKNNFWLAFGFGILLAVLSSYPLGSLSLTYLFAVWLVSFIKRTQFSSNLMVILPLTVILLVINQIVINIAMGASLGNSLRMGPILAEAIAVMPVYLLVRFWEERFIPQKDIRLKVGK